MDKVALEIVVISAEDLKDVRKFGGPLCTFATVWTDSTNQSSTQVDRECGSNPTWNAKFQMDVSKHFLRQRGSSLTVQIYCKTMMGNKRIGYAVMPYSDILEGYRLPDSTHLLSYRVTGPSGKRRGTIDLSVRLLEKIDSCPQISTSDMKFPAFSSKSRPQTSSSYRNRPGRQRSDDNGYVIGFPLSIVQQSQFLRPQQQQITTNSYTAVPPSRFASENSIYSNFHCASSYGYHSRVSASNF